MADAINITSGIPMDGKSETKISMGLPGWTGILANGTVLSIFCVIFYQMQTSQLTTIKELQTQQYQQSQYEREFMRSEIDKAREYQRTEADKAHAVAAQRWKVVEELKDELRKFNTINRRLITGQAEIPVEDK